MEEKKLALFLADFDLQVDQLEKIYSKLKAKNKLLAKQTATAESVESSGYWLHNLYCAYEDLFKMVASFWENNLDHDGTFHKSLIRRMLLTIEGVRPALISETSFRHLDELRGFRHVFRHAYSYGLADDRVQYLMSKVLNEQPNILGELSEFRKQIALILSGNA